MTEDNIKINKLLASGKYTKWRCVYGNHVQYVIIKNTEDLTHPSNKEVLDFVKDNIERSKLWDKEHSQ